MRTILVASLALAAALAAAPLAAKPPAVDPSDPREVYRGRAISLCVAEMKAVEGITPDGLEALCGCAVDRFMPRWPTGGLPPLGAGRLRPAMAGELLACATGRDSRLAAAVARRLADPPPVSPTVSPSVPPPVSAAGAPAPDKPEPSGPAFDLWAWLGRLSLPSRLFGLPIWAWLPIALLALVLLRALFRRREGQDLLGPPAHMRRNVQPRGPPRP